MNKLEIQVERNPSPMKLEVLGVENWGIWRKEKSTFPWHYNQQETCYILRGRFIVTPEGISLMDALQSEENDRRMAEAIVVTGRAPAWGLAKTVVKVVGEGE